MDGPAYEPVGLVGDVIERLKVDPEVVETRRRLTRGVVMVAVCIVAAIILDRVSPWSLRERGPVQTAPAPLKPAPSVTKKENNVIGMVGSDTDPAAGKSLPEAIVFEGAAQADPEVAGELPASPPNPIRIQVPAPQTAR